MSKTTTEQSASADAKQASQPYAADSAPLQKASYFAPVYDAPFSTDPALAGKSLDATNELDSFTLLKASLAEPIVVDPRHLDYDNLLRVVFGKGRDVQAGLLLTLSKWGVMMKELLEVIPKTGSTARYRRGVPCLIVDQLQSWARKMVKEAAKDSRASKLDPRWQAAAEWITGIIIQAMFAPLEVVMGIKPLVDTVAPTAAMPTYDDLLAISQHLALRDVLIRNDPAKALSKIDTLHQLELSEAIREYMTSLTVDLNTAGYKSERLLRTALAAIHAKLMHQSHLLDDTSLDIPVAYFASPAIAQMTRNFTLVAIATEAARLGDTSALLGPHELTSAIDYLSSVQNASLFLETRPLAEAAKYFSISVLGNSVGRRAGIIVDSRRDCEPNMKAFIIRQTSAGHLTELIPGGVTQVAFSAITGAFPSTANIDTTYALAKQLTRDSDEWQSQHARLVVADWLIGGSAAESETHRIGRNPAAFNVNTSTWLLQLAAAAFAKSTYLVHADLGWTFVYLTAPQRTELAQTVDTLSGTLLTTDPLLAIYLSAPEQTQSASIEVPEFDSDVLTKGRVSLSNLRAQGLLVEPTVLETSLPTLTGIGAGRADLDVGEVGRFLDVPAFANVAFIHQNAYARAFSAAATRTLATVSLIKANASAMKLAKGTIDIDVRLALLPMYNYLLKVSRSAVFESRITNAMNQMIARAPTHEAKLALSIEAVNAELRAEIGTQIVLWVMSALNFVSASTAQSLIDAFAAAELHTRIGALEGAINNKVMMII